MAIVHQRSALFQDGVPEPCSLRCNEARRIGSCPMPGFGGRPLFATELLGDCNQRPFGCNRAADKYLSSHRLTQPKPVADCKHSRRLLPGVAIAIRAWEPASRPRGADAVNQPFLAQLPQQHLNLASPEQRPRIRRRPQLPPLHVQPMHAPYVHESRTWAASRKLMKSKRSQRRRCRSSYSVKSSSGTSAFWASMFSSIPGH